MRPQNKFLVQLLSGFTQKQVFFGIWFLIVTGFALMMVAHYRRNTRRNFRMPGDGPPPPKTKVDARRLPAKEGADLVAKDISPIKTSRPS